MADIISTDKQAIPQQVLDLVERFRQHQDDYTSSRYNEAQARQEFIDPMLAARLGHGKPAGFAEAYKDVVHEDAIKVGGVHKAPDYSFRVGGVRKFFLEAKKPSVAIKDDAQAAFQLRRYGWSAKWDPVATAEVPISRGQSPRGIHIA